MTKPFPPSKEEGKRTTSRIMTAPVPALGALALVRPLQMGGTESSFAFIPFFIFIIFILIIVVGVARFVSSSNRVQRPLSEVTAFPPPPPPDTVMVKCEYCGTEQVWKENCIKCGAPMPKPKTG